MWKNKKRPCIELYGEVLSMLYKTSAPISAGLPQKNGTLKKCRAAWVALKLPLLDGTKRILAPLYDPRHKGERVLLDRKREGVTFRSQ